MTEQVKLERRKKITKIILVTVTVLFIFVMLVVPLFSVMASALKEGLGFYLKAISTSYVLSALKVTLIATVFAVVINTFFGIWTAWLLTRFSFKGKQVLATLIRHECENPLCNTGSCACYDICHVSVCVKGNYTGAQCRGKG